MTIKRKNYCQHSKRYFNKNRLIACVRCNRKIHTKYSIDGLCQDCFLDLHNEEELKAYENEKNKNIFPDPNLHFSS